MVLAFLGTIVTILILLNRLADAGIDLGGLNPFLWYRRRQWRQRVDGNPIYRIDHPMDATAILMVAVAKADGDLSREDKQALLDSFEREFRLSKKDAAALLTSSAHLLGDGIELRENVAKFLQPSEKQFSEEQRLSALALIADIAGAEGARHENAAAILAEVRSLLEPRSTVRATW